MLQFNILASFANDNDALIPELWARESIAVLEENMVMGQLVHRDFSMDIANYGDVVNTRKPVDGTVDRKTDADSVSYEDAVLTNVQVPLNQHMYAAFVIKDGERSKSLQDLVQIHLVTRMKAMGNGIDRAIVGRMAHELIGSPSDRVGQLGQLDAASAYDTVLEAREALNRSLAWTSGRNMVLAPGSETAMLKSELFVRANERGDGGVALEEARLGRIGGFDTFMDQNVNGVLSNSDRDTATGDTLTDAEVAGEAGALATTSTAGEAGAFVVIEGNDQPTYASAFSSGVSVTLNEALKFDTAAGAAITWYNSCDANGTFAAGYAGYVNLDGFTSGKPPVVGQLIATGSAPRHTYTVIETRPVSATEVQVLLDRPLEYAIADGDACFPGPAGDFNVAFHRNAFALVSRPLARPDSSMGARSFVASYNDIAMRATMQYDIDAQGTKVVIDMLCGTAVLDSSLAKLVLG